ncbi:WbqC family protein [Elizabethkingia meningoseptica]|uniref:WbqC family protein n=1 Tax=Elizabethkingia meningoseptica TaxID=238 RepID=UPI0038914EA1
MNNVLLPVFYLPPVQWFAEFLNENNEIVLEEWENFPKQTYRNRTEIYGANGKLALIIPTKHTGNRLYKETEVSYAENWQKLHWKSIKTAYQSSPYFEFYESQLEDVYSVQPEKLMEFNLRALNIILKLIKAEKSFTFTSGYEAKPECNDLRDSFSAKKTVGIDSKEYYQVFSDKLGYIPNLSVLDLLCNLGPESAAYLRNFK